MWKLLQKFRIKSWLSKKQFMLALMLCSVATAAFCLGRRRGHADGQAGQADASAELVNPTIRPVRSSDSNYDQRPVAYIYNNTPITREDLGEYLIARFGTQRVEFLVNRRIVELACKLQGIEISDANVETQFQEDLKTVAGTPVNQEQFVNQILRRFNKTLYEWKEDVIRPRLMLTRLARPRVRVTEEDLHKAFEAKYGEALQCRMIVFAEKMPKAKLDEIWAKVSKSEEEFREAARTQFVPGLASKGGEVPPIHHYFAGPDGAELEKEAFSLKEGDVSRLLKLPDKTWVILKCDKRLPPDTTKTFGLERVALQNEVFQLKLQQETNVVFEELRRKATPYLLLVDESHRPSMAQGSPKELSIQPVSYENQGSIPPPVPNKKLEDAARGQK